MQYSHPSPAHAIAAQALTGRRITHGSQIAPERYELAIATLGSGLDHAEGETTIALADGGLDRKKFVHGAVFSDRRMLARTKDGTIDIPYPAIAAADISSGVVLDDVQITAWGRAFKLSGMPESRAVLEFFRALLRLHPSARVPPPRPPSIPTHDDPTGGIAARAGIWSRDPRVLPLLGMAIEGHRGGSLTADLGADLVARAMLFDRTLAYGRGSREGWWTSALGAPDLAYAFSRMLGAPMREWQEGNARAFDFRVGSGSNAAGAAASTAVGLLALGVLGVGWVSTPGRSLDVVRVRIAPGKASTGFAIFDGQSPLSREWPLLIVSLFEILPQIEGRMLLKRAAFGWSNAPAELDATPTQALSQRVASTIGPIDLRMFFPPARR